MCKIVYKKFLPLKTGQDMVEEMTEVHAANVL